MTPGGAAAVASRLRRLAAQVEPPDGADTAARAVAVDRARRRRTANRVAGALAVVLLGAGVPLARSAVTEPPATALPPATASSYVAPPALYEAPVRGSLAGDEEFLATMADAPWTWPAGPDGAVASWSGPEVEPGTGRVVYAADVPGGHRWAVVVARAGSEWLWVWFTGPRGAQPAEMVLTTGVAPLRGRDRLALMDASAETGPLVVLGEPELEAEYSASLDRAPSGELVREYAPLPRVDGVPLGMVASPMVWFGGEVRVTSSVAQNPLFPMLSGRPPSWPDHPSGPVDETLVAPCLEALGFTVELGSGLTYSEPVRAPMSSAEEAAEEERVAACFWAAAR